MTHNKSLKFALNYQKKLQAHEQAHCTVDSDSRLEQSHATVSRRSIKENAVPVHLIETPSKLVDQSEIKQPTGQLRFEAHAW